MEKRIIGYAPVDSGQLIVIDPCYLRNWKAGNFGPGEDNHYNDACNATLGDTMGGEVLVSNIAGNGVAFSTGWGDGNYPVEAIYQDGRVKEVRIKFF